MCFHPFQLRRYASQIRLVFAEEVAEGGEGMVEEHAGARPAHDAADALFHLGPVAVDGAAAARGFVGAEAAAVEARAGIVEQLGTAGAELAVALPAAAVEPYHLFGNGLFLFDALGLFHLGVRVCFAGPGPRNFRGREGCLPPTKLRKIILLRNKAHFWRCHKPCLRNF